MDDESTLRVLLSRTYAQLEETKKSANAWQAIAEYREREIDRLVFALQEVRRKLGASGLLP